MEERISKFIASEGISPTKFADIIGVQRSAISHILTGRNKPSFDLIQKILTKFPKLSAEWLLMGRGEMYKITIQQRLFDNDTNVNRTGLQEKKAVDKGMVIDNLPFETKTSNVLINEKNVERVIIFYNDKSFKEYFPS